MLDDTIPTPIAPTPAELDTFGRLLRAGLSENGAAESMGKDGTWAMVVRNRYGLVENTDRITQADPRDMQDLMTRYIYTD